MADAFAAACKHAATEMGLPLSTFPEECPWELDALFADQGEPDA